MIIWLSKAEYAAKTGKTLSEVQRLIDEKLVTATKTDGGGKWMILAEEDSEVSALKAIMLAQDRKIDALCKHLGLRIQEGA